MDIKDLKSKLTKAIQDVEDTYNTYVGKISDLNEQMKQNEMKQMQMMRDDEKLSLLLDKYQEVASLETARENARLTIQGAEEMMSHVAKERAEFEQYKSEQQAKIDKDINAIVNEERKLDQKEASLQKAIEDFNIDKEKYHYKTEGPATW